MSKHKNSPDVIYFGPAQRYATKRFISLLPILLIPHVWLLSGGIAYMVLVASGIVPEEDPLRDLTVALVAALINLSILALESKARRNARYEMHQDGVSVYSGSWTRKAEFTPFRRINKLEVSYGPLDRLFGLGEVTLHTGPRQSVKLVGLPFADDVYDHIAGEMNRMDRALFSPETDTWILPPASLPEELPSGRSRKTRPTSIRVQR